VSDEPVAAATADRSGQASQACDVPQADAPRRFGGVTRLYGDDALPRLAAAHVCVVGVGGVGSWAAEALARSGIGRLTLVDLDHVAESNLNRQVHALGSTLGAAKVEVMRRRIAEHMVQSLLHTAPHVTTVFQADMSAVLAHRAEHRAAFERTGAPLTLTAYFVAACVDALQAVPEANGRWTEDAVLIPERIDIGVGTALEGRGLVVPVIRDVARLDLAAIAAALAELVERARADRLTPADLRGGTFTISNHGVSGSLLAAPIVINQPQSAILGVGKLEKRAVVVSQDGRDEIVIRPCCYVTLTIDHRVLDGHQANRFMETLVRRLERWN